ncbi:hypothetical protein TorRG33x02_102230 [Trema orientale]|uniref:Uncharacterized protein n=1 Tax=Trema orientale TaxID=63057 RepID=A0A2P5F7Q7_TREOI|nr:hypothetical protein TorRG33x02_102230 [Trema orientale]
MFILRFPPLTISHPVETPSPKRDEKERCQTSTKRASCLPKGRPDLDTKRAVRPLPRGRLDLYQEGCQISTKRTI